MTQTFLVRINGKAYYFRAPDIDGIITFPAHRDILMAYLRKTSKNNYEVAVAYKNYFVIYKKCTSIKKACAVLQIVYNGDL